MLNVSGVFKLIGINAKGTAKNGQKYVTCSAVSFFDQKSQEDRENGEKDRFYTLSAFGSTAEFIIKNFKPEAGARRAFIVGDLELKDYTTQQKVSKILKVGGQKVKASFDIDVDKVYASIRIADIRFLDKPNAKASDEIECEVVDGEDDIVECEVCDDTTEEPAGEHKNVTKSSKSKKKDDKKLPDTLPEDDEVTNDEEVE